jgi:ABC-type amino acid transport system permease subunit
LKAKFLRRDVLMQAAVLGALLLAMVWLVANVQSNLERQNINSN